MRAFLVISASLLAFVLALHGQSPLRSFHSVHAGKNHASSTYSPSPKNRCTLFMNEEDTGYKSGVLFSLCRYIDVNANLWNMNLENRMLCSEWGNDHQCPVVSSELAADLALHLNLCSMLYAEFDLGQGPSRSVPLRGSGEIGVAAGPRLGIVMKYCYMQTGDGTNTLANDLLIDYSLEHLQLGLSALNLVNCISFSGHIRQDPGTSSFLKANLRFFF